MRREGESKVMQFVRSRLGIDSVGRTTRAKNRASFNKVQTLSRTYMADTMVRSSLTAYKDSDVVKRVQWLTASDNRVCSICLGFRNKTWKLDSPRLRRPVRDSHPNCRCDLAPVVAKVDPTIDVSGFDDWLAQF